MLPGVSQEYTNFSANNFFDQGGRCVKCKLVLVSLTQIVLFAQQAAGEPLQIYCIQWDSLYSSERLIFSDDLFPSVSPLCLRSIEIKLSTLKCPRNLLRQAATFAEHFQTPVQGVKSFEIVHSQTCSPLPHSKVQLYIFRLRWL